MTDRKFYKLVVTVEILSELPIGTPNLETISEEVIEGAWSGKVEYGPEEILDGLQAAKALHGQASHPSFFRLTKTGDDL